jgi:metal-responsive CopG/Arc/MetJ family transcriptional regulator
MKRIIIQVDEAILAELDRAAQDDEDSRAGFARRAIEAALAERRRQQELNRVVESFAQRPPEELTASKKAIRRAWPG